MKVHKAFLNQRTSTRREVSKSLLRAQP